MLRTALVSLIVYLSLGHSDRTLIFGIINDVDVVYGCLAGGANVAVNGYFRGGHFHREVEVFGKRIGTETSTHLVASIGVDEYLPSYKDWVHGASYRIGSRLWSRTKEGKS